MYRYFKSIETWIDILKISIRVNIFNTPIWDWRGSPNKNKFLFQNSTLPWPPLVIGHPGLHDNTPSADPFR